MDFVCGIVSGIVTEIGKLLCRPLGQRIWYMLKFKSNVLKLQEQEKDLKLKKDSVQHAVDDAERQVETIEPEVDGWLHEVQEWLNKVEKFTDRLANVTNEENKKCFKGCPNLKTCFVDRMEAVKLVKECDRLLAKGIFQRVAHRSFPPTPRFLSDKGDNAFYSRESVFKQVIQTLKSSGVNAIGVHGMGGVGKTTLVEKVRSHAKKDRLFHQVVMATVTQNPNPIKIQTEIAVDLGLVLPEGSVKSRANILHERLKKEESVLVILDDVWKEVNIDAIGIPVRTADCKLLLTSRDLRVCNFMKTEKNIPVTPLTFEEALTLFWKSVADLEKQSQFGSIAAKIVEKCAGLPIAILTIAKTLKHESHAAVWNEILKDLVNFKFDGLEDFHSVIGLSYSFLTNEYAKSLFLLCGLYPIGHFIHINDDLVRSVMGLGLFRNVNTLKEVRNKVDKSIKDLKAASLLLDSSRKDLIKVHDVIHIVAQAVASRDESMFNIQVVDRLEGELEKRIYKNSKAIALHHVDARELPDPMPEFPQLELMLINNSSSKIPYRFFDRMKRLNVLSLYEASLNASLGCLMNLKTLCLDDCRLGDINAVGELKKLEVLSFSGSNIKKLPEEIGELTRLKLLDLERCSQLEVIPPNVLSKLEQLEELYIGDSFVIWDVQKNASLTELKQLTRLTVLSIHVMDAQIIPQDLFLEKLEDYMIVVGEGWPSKWAFSWENQRTLKLKISNGKEFGVRKLLKKTKKLYLGNLNGFKNTHPDLGGEGFPDLRSLHVQNDPHISHIVKLSEECGSRSTYPMLESLFLCKLINLEKICHGELRAETFGNLKIIKVEKCAALTHLIPLSTTRAFLRLQEIKVEDCINLKEIVGNEMQENNIAISEIKCAELHTLTLNRLPKLRNFGPTFVQEDDHIDFIILFGVKVSFPSLKNLTLWYLNIPNIWCNQLPSSYSFSETLTSLNVANCPHLKFLFSSSMVNGLQQLEELNVANCKSMEVIINKEGPRGEKVYDSLFDVPEGSSTKAMIIFPKLTRLTLYGLRKLKSFYHGRQTSEWPSLKELRVESCVNVEIFGSKYQSLCEEKQIVPQPLFIVNKDAFPRLERLELLWNDNLKEIWHGGGIISKTLLFRGKTNIIKFPHYLLPTDTLDIPSGYFNQIGGGSDNTFTAALRELRTLTVDGDSDSLDEYFESSDNLACLVSFWVSFQNLTNLKIIDLCSGFSYLLTHSTATSLQHLTRLEISFCEKIEVVIMPPTDEVNDKIVFSQLKYLELRDLDSLTSFYSDSHTLGFPSLEKMIVDGCPNMKVFSEGDSITQKLQRIQLQQCYDDEWRWEGDLNSTIQKMFKEMNVQKIHED